MTQFLLPIDLPPIDLGAGVRKPITTCGYCNRTVLRTSPTFVQTPTDDYCCEECADADALKRLREAGL